MAGLFEFRGRWILTEKAWRTPDGKIKQQRKQFATKEEALIYAAEFSLVFGAGRRTPRTPERVIADLAENSALTDGDCVEWTADLTNAGYGRFTWKSPEGMIRGAHRVAYHVLVAPVPVDKVIDHLCRNRKCIRLDHLDVVQQRENVMRSPIAPAAINAAKTHCPQGHEYSPENTYVYTFKTKKTTTRICRACASAHHRRYYLRKKATS
jgi:hypothetical protein